MRDARGDARGLLDRTVAALRAATTPEALAVTEELRRRLEDLAEAGPEGAREAIRLMASA